jgi:L-2-amino-thiazoline-4-carboxylic acid hydrolase
LYDGRKRAALTKTASCEEIPMTNEMPILTRRRIEAEFAKGLYDEMIAEVGEETARRVLANAVIKLARAAAAKMASEATGGPSLEHFQDIQKFWTAEDALRIETLTSGPNEFNFNVTRCRYAEMYREMGLAELGAILSCNRDGAFCQGYDPKLKLTRTQTLMEGATHCDFRYRYED